MRWNIRMRPATAVLGISAAVSFWSPSAHAGPCTASIAQFEQAVRQSAGNPDAGPLAAQSVGAQLGHEPTSADLKRARGRATAAFNAALTRAKRLDAGGNARCADALARAKGMYQLP
jgi:hypothetical protein